MKHKEMLAVLKSMRILIDTREQDTPKARRRISVIGLPVDRVALDYGDYSYNATLPDGSDIYDLTAGRIRPSCAIGCGDTADAGNGGDDTADTGSGGEP